MGAEERANQPILTDAYGMVPEWLYQLAQANNVSPSDMEDLMDNHGRTSFERIGLAIERGEHL